MQDADASGASPCAVLLACGGCAAFPVRVAPFLQALRPALAAAAATHDPCALLPLLSIVHKVVLAPDVRFSFPDTKDLCMALLDTLPGKAESYTMPCEQPGGSAGQIPSSYASQGGCDPGNEALACSICALQCAALLLARNSAASPPWVALHCRALQRAASALSAHTPDACWRSVAPVAVDACGHVNEAQPANSSLLGLCADLASLIATCHHSSLQVAAGATSAQQPVQHILSGTANAADLLTTLVSVLQRHLLPLYASNRDAVHADLVLPSPHSFAACQECSPGLQSHGSQSATHVALWQALVAVLDILPGTEAAMHASRQQHVHANLHRSALAQQCVAAGLLQHMFRCVLLAENLRGHASA